MNQVVTIITFKIIKSRDKVFCGKLTISDGYSIALTNIINSIGQRHLFLLKRYILNCKFVQLLYAYMIQFLNSKNLSLGLFNAGSLSTRHEEFIVMLERHAVDILAINETWLRAGEESRAPAPYGYRLRHVPRPTTIRPRGGGVGFYIRQGFRTINHPPTPNVEQMWLSLRLNGHSVAIGTAYRPPWLNIDTFIDSLTESVSFLSSFDYIILMGDFNINLLLQNDSQSSKLQQFLTCVNFKQYVLQATHFTDHSQTLIDLICSNTGISGVNIDYVPDLGSHAFISCKLRIKKPKLVPRWITYRPIKDISLENFNRDVGTIVWDKMCGENINDTVAMFNASILYIFDLHAPI